MTSKVDPTYSTESDYLTPEQIEYFTCKLHSWRKELMGVSEDIMLEFKEAGLREPDPIDYGAMHAEKERGLMTKSRNNQLITRIEHALHRLKQGEFGYCEMTGEKIGIERLMAMPIATLSVEAQEMIERQQLRGRRAA